MSLSNVETVVSNKFGTKVVRAAADIFDGTTTSVFTVSGGLVQINFIIMQVIGADLDATVNNIKFVSNPTSGSTIDLTGTTINVASNGQEHLYTPRGRTESALDNGQAVPAQLRPYIVNPGTIDLVTSGDSNDGNSALQRIILYFSPVEVGGLIVAT